MADVRGTAQDVVLVDGTTRTQQAIVTSAGAQLIQGAQPSATTFSAITATGTQTSTSVVNYNVATVTLRTFTGTTPSVTWKLQASDDNTNWIDLQGINNTTGQVGVSWTQASALTAGTAGPSIDYTVGAYTNVRINVTAISGTSATAAFGLGLQAMPYEASPGALAQGLAASGSAPVGNPVLIAGSDGTNARSLSTDTSGRALTTNQAPSDGTHGWSFNYQAALGATKVQIKSTAGTFGGYLNLMNPNTTDAFVQVFNKASASVTVGTTTPDFVIRLPGLATASGTGVAANLELVNGMAMSTGITVAATTTATGNIALTNALTATFLFL